MHNIFCDTGMWCNGNTSDFDSDIVGSNPAVPAMRVFSSDG
jgi:hypothetical protein